LVGENGKKEMVLLIGTTSHRQKLNLVRLQCEKTVFILIFSLGS
jgi:hypothetical protein